MTDKHLIGQLWCRGSSHLHRLQNSAHLHHHGLHSPSEVSLDGDGGSPSPGVAMGSVAQNRNHLALPALAYLPAPMPLPTLTPPPAPVPVPALTSFPAPVPLPVPPMLDAAVAQAAPPQPVVSPRRRPLSPLPYSPASASAMSHVGGRCPARGRSYSRTWGTSSAGGSSGNTPDGRRNGCGDAGVALPCNISCGDLLPGMVVLTVRFRVSHALCTASAQRISDEGGNST